MATQCCCCVTVQQSNFAVVERLGKFSEFRRPGISVMIPCMDIVAGTISSKLMQHDVDVETKTKDNVFVNVQVGIQYEIDESKKFEAFYKLEEVSDMLQSNIEDVIRSEVPKLSLDELFESKEEMAMGVKNDVGHIMESYGYIIARTLVTDIRPASEVKDAMNQINASERSKISAANEADAAKVRVIKAAEAEAKSKELQGMGIANQRKAIIEGLKDSVSEFVGDVGGTTAADAMNMVLLTQYFDTLKDIGQNPRTNAVFTPFSSENGGSNLADQIRDGMLTAQEGTAVQTYPGQK